jgi:hypothetical protein
MTDLGNNQKIRNFMNDKVLVDDTKEKIKQLYIQIDNLIYDLKGKQFSYETHNYYENNKPFFDIQSLKSDIRYFETALSKEQLKLDNSEELAKGLEWIV